MLSFEEFLAALRSRVWPSGQPVVYNGGKLMDGDTAVQISIPDERVEEVMSLIDAIVHGAPAALPQDTDLPIAAYEPLIGAEAATSLANPGEFTELKPEELEAFLSGNVAATSSLTATTEGTTMNTATTSATTDLNNNNGEMSVSISNLSTVVSVPVSDVVVIGGGVGAPIKTGMVELMAGMPQVENKDAEAAKVETAIVIANAAFAPRAAGRAFNRPIKYAPGLLTDDVTQAYEHEGARYIRNRAAEQFVTSGNFAAELAQGKWFKLRDYVGNGGKPREPRAVPAAEARTTHVLPQEPRPASPEHLQALARKAKTTGLANLSNPGRTAALLATPASNPMAARLAAIAATASGVQDWTDSVLNIWTQSDSAAGRTLDLYAGNDGIVKLNETTALGRFHTWKGFELWLRLVDKTDSQMVSNLKTKDSGWLRFIQKSQPQLFTDVTADSIALTASVIWAHIASPAMGPIREELLKAGRFESKFLHGEEVDEATGEVIELGQWRHTIEAWWIVPMAKAFQAALLEAEIDDNGGITATSVDFDALAKSAIEDNERRRARRYEQQQALRNDDAPSRSRWLDGGRDAPKPKYGGKKRIDADAGAKAGKKGKK